jgi:hypothetical protein
MSSRNRGSGCVVSASALLFNFRFLIGGAGGVTTGTTALLVDWEVKIWSTCGWMRKAAYGSVIGLKILDSRVGGIIIHFLKPGTCQLEPKLSEYYQGPTGSFRNASTNALRFLLSRGLLEAP